MKRHRLILAWLPLLLLLAAGPTTHAQSNPPSPVTLVASNSYWRYLDTGTNLGTAWRGSAFSDFFWPSGPAQLGFGDGDEATVVANNGQITTYFRQRFFLMPNVTLSNLTARLTYDDGAVVYLNGAEAFRVNMPAATVSNSTPAITVSQDNALHVATLPANLLVGGTNVAAVEVHQADAASSDLSFALELIGNLAATPSNAPPVITQPPANAVVAAGGTASFTVVTTGTPPFAYQWRKEGVPLTNGPRIQGVTQPTLIISNVVPADAGPYGVTVSNAYGQVSSPIANLTALMPAAPSIAFAPSASPPTNVRLQLLATLGHALVVQASSNLNDWFVLAGNVAPSGPLFMTDGSARTLNERFYRVWDTTADLYSSNVIGFAGVTLPPGPSLLANPFVNSSNTVSVLPWMPDGMTLFKANEAGFVANNRLGEWSVPGMTLAPGEGCVVANPYAGEIRLFLQGEVPSEAFRVELPGTTGLFSAPVPKAGRIVTDLGFPAQSGDAFIRLEHSLFTMHTYLGQSAWAPLEPAVNLGEALWFINNSGLPRTWIGGGGGEPPIAVPAFTLPGPQINFFTYNVDPGYGRVRDVQGNDLGSSYQGQLYAGLTPDEGSFVPVGAPSRFGNSGVAYGYINAAVQTVHGLAGTRYFQLRVWTNGIATYEAALASPLPRGKSAVFAAQLGIGLEPPPNANLFPTFNLVSPPQITQQPVSASKHLGSPFWFFVWASGTPPLEYQWLFNDVPLNGATNYEIQFSGVQSNNAGNYRVIVHNAYGSVTSAVATLTLLPPAPQITFQPASQNLPVDERATFRVVATGAPPLRYQWLFNGLPLPGATNESFTRYQVRMADTGDYQVIVTNAYGIVASVVATLTVYVPPPASFEINPVSQGAVVNESLVLRSYNSSVGYGRAGSQWFLNGQPISDATNASLRLDGLTPEQAGQYYVVAANSAGAVTSRVATVTISPRGPLDAWTWRRPLPQGNDLRAVAYGNGVLVAVGRDGGRVRSTDGGVVWVSHPGAKRDCRALAFGQGQFVALPENYRGGQLEGLVLISTNGADWVEHVVPALTGIDFHDLAFGNGRFVAVSDNGRVAVSTNGWDWTVAAPSGSGTLRRLVFANGQFVATTARQVSEAGAGTGIVAVSSDGLNWSEQVLDVPSSLNDITYGNGVYAICSAYRSDRSVYLSSNLVSWTARTLPVSSDCNAIAAGIGRFVVVGDDPDGLVFTSTNGSNWTHQFLTPSNKLYSVTYTLGQFIAVGEYGNIFTSTNGMDWTARSAASDLNFRSIVRGNGVYVAVGNDGLLFTSPDAVAWTAQPRPTTNNIRGVTFGAGRFVAVGDYDTAGGLVLVSSDGVQWTRQPIFGAYGLYDLTFAAERFVAVGDAGRAWTSLDGLAWAARSTGAGYRLNSITWSGAEFVAVGQYSTVVSSPDGTNWTRRLSSGSGEFLQGIAFGNGTYVAVGQDGFVITATDLADWDDEEATAFDNDMEDLLFANGLFVAVGQEGFCATSPDGEIWTQHNTTCANDLRTIIYEDGRFTVVGNNETILQSALAGSPGPFVRREIAGQAVRLLATPAPDVGAYAVEDQVPAGLLVTNITPGGAFDPATRKVKFGPFYDAQPRAFSYEVQLTGDCSYDVCGSHTVTGIGSADGVDTPIQGDSQILNVGWHPADLVEPHNLLAIGEVTAYGAAWRRGSNWTVGPNPIPIDYVTRAAFLWRGGECYALAAGTNPPLCWVNCAPAGSADFQSAVSQVFNLPTTPALPTAVRMLPAAFVPGESLTVHLTITLPVTAQAYALAETIPSGWTVAGISDGGEFDPVNGQVKWGPFFDATPRDLSYRLGAPVIVHGLAGFAGVASCDGTSVAIGGTSESAASARLIALAPLGEGRYRLRVEGVVDERVQVEASRDLVEWELLDDVSVVDGLIEFTDSASGAAPQRFYRTRPMP